MRKGLVGLVFRNHRSVGKGAAIVGCAVACAALVAGLRSEGRPAVRHAQHPRAAAPARVAWSGTVHGALALSHGALPVGDASTLYAMLTVGARSEAAAADRAPVSFVLVVDRSGSMGGQKIEEARAAAAALVRSLRPDDELALVAYSDTPQLLVPRASVAQVRERALTTIAGLQIEGGTAIGPALEMGRQALAESSSDRVRRVVLVSDGIDESGMPLESIVGIAASAARAGVSVSTLGIGTDYAEELMTKVADASHGNYHYVRTPDQLAGILALELGQMAGTVANDVTARITLPPGVALVRTTGASATAAEGAVHLDLGSLFASDERRVILELTAAPVRAGRLGALAVDMSWRDRATGEARSAASQSVEVAATADATVVQSRIDRAVLEEGLEVAAVARHEAARVAWRSGDAAGARRIEEDNLRQLEERNGWLQSGELSAQIREYTGALGDMLGNDARSAAGEDIERRITVSNRGRGSRDLGEGGSW